MTALEPSPEARARRVGVVVIGRNEGDRLGRCLASLSASLPRVVYVDSKSTDGSPARAAAMGADVLALDLATPFTAARARNEGAARLFAHWPETELVQFVDGDCVVDSGWIDAAVRFLDANSEVVVVCGRRREREPDRSVYNRLCDIEWDTPVGEAKACGGDALMRRAAFVAVGGFRPELIAGEEPELCVRLRANGGRIWRLGHEMTLHDAAMTRFGQWWKRSMRAGHAFAEGALLHGAASERHWVREQRSALVWGLWLPIGLLLILPVLGPGAAIGWLVYPLQVVRLFLRTPGPVDQRWARAFFLVLGKFAEAFGMVQFRARLLTGARGGLIEYK